MPWGEDFGAAVGMSLVDLTGAAYILGGISLAGLVSGILLNRIDMRL